MIATYHITTSCVKIYNSFLVPKDKFESELNVIRYMNHECPIWHLRSMGSMKREWATHNLLYNLGIKRERTKDVDLNFSHRWYVNLAYWVAGTIALLVIN